MTTKEEMCSGQGKCVFVIFNPVSGTTPPEQRKDGISAALAQKGYTCQFIATTRERGAKELTRRAIEEGADLIAVSGGDGTVVEVLSALAGTDIPVAVLPAGTGNLLSVNLGIPTAIPEAVEVALSGTPYELDLARTGDGNHFAIMGGIGLDGQIMEEANRDAKNRFGVLAYLWATIKNLPRSRASVKISLDGQPPIHRRIKSVLVANMGKVTGGVAAMPTAAANDGQLDIGIVMTRSPMQWLRLLTFAMLGRAHDDPSLEVHRARTVRIESRFAQPVQFDGETAGNRQELTIKIVPRAVRVLLPADSPALQEAQPPQLPPEIPRTFPRHLPKWIPTVASLLLFALCAVVACALYRSRRRG